MCVWNQGNYRRAQTATMAPSAARHLATVAPMPLLAPVTKMTFPSSLPMTACAREDVCRGIVGVCMCANSSMCQGIFGARRLWHDPHLAALSPPAHSINTSYCPSSLQHVNALFLFQTRTLQSTVARVLPLPSAPSTTPPLSRRAAPLQKPVLFSRGKQERGRAAAWAGDLKTATGRRARSKLATDAARHHQSARRSSHAHNVSLCRYTLDESSVYRCAMSRVHASKRDALIIILQLPNCDVLCSALRALANALQPAPLP